MLAPVYSKYNQTIVRSSGSYIFNDKNQQILDFYSGHGVISIGHQNPFFVTALKEQMDKIIYYSNAVHLPIQEQLATELASTSELQGYQLFLCNSGAEAVENALKVAALQNQRKKIVALRNSFHGRTSLAVQCTDNARLRTTVNTGNIVDFIPINDTSSLEEAIDEQTCAVIVEGIQGIGGVHVPTPSYWQQLRKKCDETGAVLIADEIQSGYGRSGRFFAFQRGPVLPDIITMAKGMGNGFPVAGILFSDKYQLQSGDLGTTFGGNPLAARAALSVTQFIRNNNTVNHADTLGKLLMKELTEFSGVEAVRGQGLMIGIDFALDDASPIRHHLLSSFHIICGSASSKNTIRLLPPLTVTQEECGIFLESLASTLKHFF